jgi:starch synthase
MSQRLKILLLSAEVAPFTKRGGLGDVSGSLPKALASLGHDVRVVTPAYRHIEAAARSGEWRVVADPMVLQVPTGAGPIQAGVLSSTIPGTAIPVLFVAERHAFDRPQIYGYWDDAYRFGFFSRAALDLAVAAMGWRPDVVHANDWHTAAAVMWLATAGESDDRYRAIPTVYTIHNLAHQGYAPWALLDYLGIRTSALPQEPYGEINLMARGIRHATMINTVSPTYAREIRGRDGGAGLDGLLRLRDFDVHGILNGIDDEVWNPASDPNLARNYDADTLDLRAENKAAAQARLGLPVRPDVPLVAMITRLDWQKGLDITGHVIHLLMNNQAGEAQFVALGAGVDYYEDMLRRLASYHREKMAVEFGWGNSLAPLIYAGADLFLMPSLFEPCGLGQMIAMRYGALPVVRETGGLADTVREGINGFSFIEFTADAFWQAIRRALYIRDVDPDAWRSMQTEAMRTDFSWRKSARGYQQLYQWAIARVRGW